MTEAAPSTPLAPPRARRLGRRVGWIALLLALVLGVIVVRVAIDGHAELQAADAAAAAGDAAEEVLHLGRAARLRLPLAGHDERARARLRELAERASEAGRTSDALAAWRELRRALLGTRTFTVADVDQLDAANAAIVELMILEANAAGTAADGERWTAELNEDTGSRTRSLLAALCFVVWLIACVGFFIQGIDGKGHLEPRAASRWGAAVLLGAVGWILLL